MGKFAEFGEKYGTRPMTNNPTKQTEDSNEYSDSIVEPICIDASSVTDKSKVPTEDMLDVICFRSYLRNLRSLSVKPFQQCDITNMSWIKIDKIVNEKNQNFTENLSIIYTALHETADNIAIVLQKDKGGLIHLYLGVRDMSSLTSHNYISKYILLRSVNGCLPGISYTNESPIIDNDKKKFISSVSGIGSQKGEKKEVFVQGIEKIINSTLEIPSFTIILLAENSNGLQNQLRQTALEDLYTNLSPNSETTITTSSNKGTTTTKTTTNGHTESETKSETKTSSDNKTTNESEQITEGNSGGANVIVVNQGTSRSESKTKGSSNTIGSSVAQGSNFTKGKNDSLAEAEGRTEGSGDSKQIKHEHKTTKELLKKLDLLLDRLRFSDNSGIWDFASYFIVDTITSSMTLASIYKGLITGVDSKLEISAVNTWNAEDSNKLIKYLMQCKHPQFCLSESQTVTPAISVNSDELAICMSLPQTSIPGVLVKEQPSFGRNIIVTKGTDGNEKEIVLGNLSHLGKENDQTKVSLCEEWLSSHTFITGTTGSGKSNVIYLLLSNIKESGKKFLIIEPAKGEYKNIFGGCNDVSVLGTNPNLMPLLRINPFAFPKEIHVEEHIDRLIDIFNACWPMYAAMPAVLKESITRAYKAAGWDLIRSISKNDIFPTFNDVIRELNDYINNSEYSSDSKGDYKGAIGTRLSSLTNGIIGQVFSGTPISDEILFNSNVVIDLSRVGSIETKSMIMGMLVMKLNEFRMSENIGMNVPIRHITVLEEAHNLLKSTSQSQETSNLARKSVEMIASAIAEMRTYGEGFIIADQSPSMLDKSVISNTSTKIIMALPNKDDREIAGNSISLKEQQTLEISKLNTGVAVVYQKGWEEPVLCKIDYYQDAKSFAHVHSDVVDKNIKEYRVYQMMYNSYTSKDKAIEKYELEEAIKLDSFLSGAQKHQAIELLSSTTEIDSDIIAKIFTLCIGVELFLNASKTHKTLEEFNDFIHRAFSSLDYIDNIRIPTYMNMYIKGCSLMNNNSFYNAWLVQTHFKSNAK